MTDISVTEKLGIGAGTIHARDMTTDEADRETEEVSRFITPIDRNKAVAVCIDGRERASAVHGAVLPLGPHIAGGAATVLVAAESQRFPLTGALLLAYLREHGFYLGAHLDDLHDERHTGCGACDKCAVSCRLFEDSKHSPQIEAISQLLLGDEVGGDKLSRVTLHPYNSSIHNLIDEQLIETLHGDDDETHGHHERLVLFNYLPGTTIDRDAYVEQTGKQVFTVDMWYLKELARAMAEYDDGIEGRTTELYRSMAAFQIATYLALCDGSHRAVLLKEKPLSMAPTLV